MHKKAFGLLSVLLLTLTVLTQYSQVDRSEYSYFSTRAPASVADMERLETLLAVDKLDYYIGEYINNFGKKIDDEALGELKKVELDYIIDKYSTDSRIFDAKKYDAIIYDILKERLGKKPSGSKASYEWGYNFFKNKLNEGFTLLDSKIKPKDDSAITKVEPRSEFTLPDQGIKNGELTLDADHYISNRTTRAVFWEAVESNRDVEFHLENSREFLKNLQANGGQILKEIRPFANNYNKIYAVQYPGESTYRYAITAIGGKDRLNHLMLQFGLSKRGHTVTNKVRIFGDLDDTHKMMEDELSGIFRHLPKSERVIIGQKGAIERTFETLWKVRALKNLYDDEPDLVLSHISDKLKDSFKDLMADGDIKKYDIFKNKKDIERAFTKLEKTIKAKGIEPFEFKKYDYDNYVISMSDIVFKNSKGEDVVWRVVANSWGDEISPLAKALKNTGHKNITYIGTAGAFPDKGYSVGDLVIPSHTRLDGESKKLRGTMMDIDGAKVGGTVDHVYSPFIETNEWLEESSSHSDFVEVEVSHLRKILNGQDDDLQAYLLISDVLKSEGETLASATGAKRRNSLNKLLYAMLDRDEVGIPQGVNTADNHIGILRSSIDKVLGNKANTLKYYIFSMLKDNKNVSEAAIQAAVDSVDNFSDNYFTKRITESSEVSSYVLRKLEEFGHMPKISVDKEFVDGKWHPKTGKIIINIHADTQELVDQYKEVAKDFENEIAKVSKFCEINFIRGPPSSEFVTIPKYVGLDSDFLVNLYSQSAFKQAGLDAQVTYNGNLKFNFLPTVNNTDVCADDKFCHLSFFKPDQATKDLLVDFDSHTKFKTQFNKDPVEMFNGMIKRANEITQTNYSFEVVVEKNATLEDGKLAEIVPDIDPNKGLLVKVRFTKEGYKNPLVLLEEAIHVSQITRGDDFLKHPVFWAEAALNAKHGSMRSREFLARAEVDAMDKLSNLMRSNFSGNADAALAKIEQYAEVRKAHASKIANNLKKKVRAEKTIRNGLAKQWKALHKALEAQDLKLDDYIASGNRKKVAELIEAYMPWEQMEPTEIAAWQRWVKEIENPSDDFFVSFRGLGDDLVRESDDGGHFLMAKLLTKNQGSYTRRLRSLKTYFDKKISKKAGVHMPVEFQSLAGVFKGHSVEPLGSPYLSGSVLSVADNFASESQGQKIAALKMSQNRSLLNLVSNYNELEEMIPLIVFPDEIISIEPAGDSEAIQDSVEEKIGRPLKDTELERSAVQADSDYKVRATLEWWKQIDPNGITPTNSTKTCKGVIKMFLSQQ
ncbi:hypothetical protein [Halobacteriovorax sp. ZH5_bin.2]|uniref:hypothetical protein n=1 Tax=Halobacteriovorax sp. ZH5_bin.2 TaxID=3157727 RepID=UPI0037133B81